MYSKSVLFASFVLVTAARAAVVSSFDDIQFWVGHGSNEAAIVIDWNGETSADQSLVWGYRWDGAATGEDMLRAIVSADDRLFAKISSSGMFGVALYGFGYDANDNGSFSLTDGTAFDANGIAETGPADLATSIEAADFYAEGWFTGFWHYGIADTDPYTGGTWFDSPVGMTSRDLVNGSWDTWAFTASFDFNSFAANPVAATVPEAGSVLLIGMFILAAISIRCHRDKEIAVAAGLLLFISTSTLKASDFATEVISYVPGVAVGVGNPAPFQTNGSQAIGSPSHDTQFGSQVGVFYPAFGANEITSIGAGGELTVKFDHHVENDPNNPFGIDLLIFGNAFYVRNATTKVASSIFSEPGILSVSQDGATWFTIPSVFGDTAFPTLGYTNTVYNGSGNKGGTILTDFTLPVDPGFNPIGLTEAQIEAGYNGSGGGTGVDLGAVGLDWIQYLRVSQPSTDNWSTEIDAFADVKPIIVPELSSIWMIAGAGGLFCLRSLRKR